jgi:hypothetical protein
VVDALGRLRMEPHPVDAAASELHPSSLGWMEQENNRQTDPGLGQ